MNNIAPCTTSQEAASPAAPQPISTHIENGRLAKGSKTPAGLAASARNATKHGLSGRSFCLLSNEDPKQFAAVRAQYLAAFIPRDAIEVNFVNQFVEAYWLQQRCSLFIAQTLDQEIAEQRNNHKVSAPDLTEMDLAAYASATLHDRSSLIQIYERYRSTHTRNMLRFHSALIRHRAAFGATASLPAPSDQPMPESLFLPGSIGVSAEATDTTPPTAAPLKTPAIATDYETNPLPQPKPLLSPASTRTLPLKFSLAPEAFENSPASTSEMSPDHMRVLPPVATKGNQTPCI